MHNTKQYDIEVIVNKRLKHSYITISREKKVVVKTPFSSQKMIKEVLEAKAAWIEKKLLQIETRRTLDNPPLHTLEFLQSRVECYSKMMRLNYSQLKFRKMRRRWGSCSSLGVITLNKELLKVEAELVDYVVVHELAHLEYMNHSKEFHGLVELYLPNSKKLREQLKKIEIVSA